jgi:hypothetical protein
MPVAQTPLSWADPMIHRSAGPSFSPMVQAQGKRHMAPGALCKFSPVCSNIERVGVPVDYGAHWEWAAMEAAVAKGGHKSAMTGKSITQLIVEDVAYQVKADYAQIIMWEELQQTRPKNLKASPLTVEPQRNRRGRMILYLSFAIHCEQTQGCKRSIQDEESLQPSMNNTSERGLTCIPQLFPPKTLPYFHAHNNVLSISCTQWT